MQSEKIVSNKLRCANQYKISNYNAVVYVWGLICLSTLLTKLNPLSSVFNFILIGIYFILIFISCIDRISVSSFVLIFALLVIILIDISMDSYFNRVNEIMYLPLWIINLSFFTNRLNEIKNAIKKNSNYLFRIAIAWNILVFISLFFDSSYSFISSKKTFVSFCGTEHRFASTAIFCIIITLLRYSERKNKIVLLTAILPFVSILLTNTRTYIIVLLALTLYFTMFYSRKDSTKKFLLLIGIIIIVYAVSLILV